MFMVLGMIPWNYLNTLKINHPSVKKNIRGSGGSSEI